MQIDWTDHDKDLYMSLKGCVNKGGYFSSVGQMNYMARVVGHNSYAKDGESFFGTNCTVFSILDVVFHSF